MLKAQTGEDSGGRSAAHASPTDHDHLFLFVCLDLTNPSREFFERNQGAPGNVAEFAGELFRLAHVEEQRRSRTAQVQLDLWRRQLAHAVEFGQGREVDRLILNRRLVRLERFLNATG